MVTPLFSPESGAEAWLADSSAATTKALTIPLGAFSPLWVVFAGAAGAGVAYWWMTRWAQPVNLEAWLGGSHPPELVPATVEVISPVAIGGESAPVAGAPAAAVLKASEDLEQSPEIQGSDTDPAPAPAPAAEPFLELVTQEPVSVSPPEPEPEPEPAPPAEEKIEPAPFVEAASFQPREATPAAKPAKVSASKGEATPKARSKNKAPPERNV